MMTCDDVTQLLRMDSWPQAGPKYTYMYYKFVRAERVIFLSFLGSFAADLEKSAGCQECIFSNT